MSGQIWPDRSRFKDSWVCAVHVVTRWLPEEGEEMSGQIWTDWSRFKDSWVYSVHVVSNSTTLWRHMYNFVHLPSILLYILYCTTVCTPSILLYCVLYLFFCTVYSIYSTVLCTPSILLNYVLHLFYCTMYSIYSTVLCTLSILLYCMYFVIHSTVLSAPSIFKSILCTVLSTMDSIYSARWFHVFPVSWTKELSVVLCVYCPRGLFQTRAGGGGYLDAVRTILFPGVHPRQLLTKTTRIM